MPTSAPTALLSWYGGKQTLAEDVIATLGPHRSYWEPFCGSLAVLMAKPPAVMENVNDLHGGVVNLARCIQHPKCGPQLYRKLRRIVCAEKLFEEARARCHKREKQPAPKEPDVDYAADTLFVSWCGRRGISGRSSRGHTFGRVLAQTSNLPIGQLRAITSALLKWRRRLSLVCVHNTDGLALIKKIPDEVGTVIYCDPPYVVYSDAYVHEMDRKGHIRLARALRRFKKARVVVSYYDHPTVRKLYEGWHFLGRYRTKALGNGGQRGAVNTDVAPEVLIVNHRPSGTLLDNF